MADGKRLCCLFIPDFQLQVLRREAALPIGVPALVVAPSREHADPSRVKVIAADKNAAAHGVRVGMGLVGASLACPSAHIFDLDESVCMDASQGVLAELCTRFPTVESAGGGRWFIGIRGMGLLYASESLILSAALEVASKEGLLAVGAIASNRFTAQAVATAWSIGLVDVEAAIIPAGEEPAALATLPLGLLPNASALVAMLHPLGIRTMAALAALDPRSVERRYGAHGIAMHRLARGEDNNHIDGVRPQRAWADNLTFDHPVISAQGLIFLLSPLVDHLVGQLTNEGRACLALKLTLTLEDKSTIDMPLDLAAPTEQPRVVTDLLRLKLAKVSLTSGALSLAIKITQATSPSRSQQDLFARAQSGTGMAMTLARLRSQIGQHTVATARLTDGYLPLSRYAMEAELPATKPTRRKPAKPSPPPLDSEPTEALRCFGRPRAIFVSLSDSGRPLIITMAQQTREITQVFGPLRYDGGWWKGAGFGRDYHRVLIEGDSELLIYRDRTSDTWFLEGVYD